MLLAISCYVKMSNYCVIKFYPSVFPQYIQMLLSTKLNEAEETKGREVTENIIDVCAASLYKYNSLITD